MGREVAITAGLCRCGGETGVPSCCDLSSGSPLSRQLLNMSAVYGCGGGPGRNREDPIHKERVEVEK